MGSYSRARQYLDKINAEKLKDSGVFKEQSTDGGAGSIAIAIKSADESTGTAGADEPVADGAVQTAEPVESPELQALKALQSQFTQWREQQEQESAASQAALEKSQGEAELLESELAARKAELESAKDGHEAAIKAAKDSEAQAKEALAAKSQELESFGERLKTIESMRRTHN